MASRGDRAIVLGIALRDGVRKIKRFVRITVCAPMMKGIFASLPWIASCLGGALRNTPSARGRKGEVKL